MNDLKRKERKSFESLAFALCTKLICLPLVCKIGPSLVICSGICHVHDIPREVVHSDVEVSRLHSRNHVTDGGLCRQFAMESGQLLGQDLAISRTEPVHAWREWGR